MTHPRGNFYLKETDEDIIRWFAQFHYLQPMHLQLLSGRNIVGLRRRLRKLCDEKLLTRTTVPFARSAPIWSPPDQYVYYLSRQGVILARDLGFTDGASRSNEEKSVNLLPHDLFLTTFHLTLALATEATDSLRLTFWEQRRSVLLDSIEVGGARCSINPDALFFLKDDTKPNEANTTCFFLEYERSRPAGHVSGESNFIRKMRAYEEYHRIGRDKERWDVPNFRVITVAPTQERALNLCKSLKNAHPPLISERFWFNDARQISLDRRVEVLEEICISSNDTLQNGEHTLTC